MDSWASRIALLIAVLGATISAARGAPPPSPAAASSADAAWNRDSWLSLAGEHRFAAGDDPARADPEFDDASWRRVSLPGHRADWEELTSELAGWYRLRFRLDSLPPDARPAVALGVVLHGDEVFLNGVRIGGTGRFGPELIEGPWRERVYPFPPSLLRSDEPNVLAVRVLLPEPGGFVDGALGIGDFDRLDAAQERRAGGQRLVEGALLGVLAFFAAVSLGALGRSLSLQQASFAALTTLVLAACVLDSRWFFEAGGKSGALQRVYYSLSGFIPMAGMAFAASWLCGRPGRAAWALAAADGALGLYVLLVPYAWAWLATIPWLTVNVGSYGLILWWSARTWRRDSIEHVPFVLGLALGSTTFVLDSFAFGQRWLYGSAALAGMCVLVVGMAVAMLLRHRRLQERVSRTTAMVLSAHESERRRVARDLHDGVGQLLQAVKLGLSMLARRARDSQHVDTASLAELVDETSQAIEEVRRVSHDLRPEFLEHQELLEALRWYVRRVSERTDVRIEVIGDPLPPLTDKLRDHVYRLFQESLNNVLAHAAAQSVEVRLTATATRLRLSICDDGRGFDPVRTTRRGGGVGLASMAERIEILEGRMTIDSGPGRGTTVTFDVPLDSPSDGLA